MAPKKPTFAGIASVGGKRQWHSSGQHCRRVYVPTLHAPNPDKQHGADFKHQFLLISGLFSFTCELKGACERRITRRKRHAVGLLLAPYETFLTSPSQSRTPSCKGTRCSPDK